MNPAQHILTLLLLLYRWTLSPAKQLLLGPSARCRFTPSCSEYAIEAVRVHGTGRGTALSVKRLCRCHPWGGCGHDPVPRRKGESPMPNSESSLVAAHPSHPPFVIRNS